MVEIYKTVENKVEICEKTNPIGNEIIEVIEIK